MSALAHRLEEHGLPTVAIGLVRAQMEKVRPPRGLWVPFELGRPLGEPDDPVFQRRVLLQALRLLESDSGPCVIEDFPDDPPGWLDRPGWRAPFGLPRPMPLPQSSAIWAERVAAEMAVVRPFWDAARARFGRTTVGLSGLVPEDWPELAARFLEGGLPTVAAHGTPALALRFLIDDLKAFYSEAAQSVGEPPASRQIDRWFWAETLAAHFLFALRASAMTSDNNALRTVGGRFFVPAPFLPKPAG